jgi:hypothetical protein
MAFCAYCGKQIADGEVCGCEGSVAAQQSVQNQGMANQQGMYNQGMPNQGMYNQGMPNQGMYNQGMPNQGMYNQGMPNQQGMYQGYPQQSDKVNEAMSQAKNILDETFGHLKLLLKSPSEYGSRFVAAANTKVSWTLLILQGIAAGLLALILAYKVNSLVNSASSAVSRYSYSGLTQKINVFSLPKVFLLTIIASIIIGLIYTLFSWLVTLISSGKTSFSQMLGVAGVRAAVFFPITVVTAVISLVSPIVGSVLFYAITVYLSPTLQMESIKAVPNISNDKKAYAVAIATLIFNIIVVLLITYMATKCLNINETLQDVLEEIF